MISVLVTGLIGSGKSAVCSFLAEAGYPVYDSDSHVKALYKDPAVASKVLELTGFAVDRLGGIFGYPDKLLALEEYIHPIVLEDFRRFADRSGSDVVFFESAIATCKPVFAGAFDKVLLVRADSGLRASRNPKAVERSSFQGEPSEYDYLIENNGSLDDLKYKTDLIIRQL